jgi:hypothetical protein
MTLSPYMVKHRCSNNIVTMTINYEPHKIVTERHKEKTETMYWASSLNISRKNTKTGIWHA